MTITANDSATVIVGASSMLLSVNDYLIGWLAWLTWLTDTYDYLITSVVLASFESYNVPTSHAMA